MKQCLQRSLRQGIVHGRLRLTFADGHAEDYGDGKYEQVAIRLADDRAALALFLDPAMKLGELYTDGRLTLEGGDAYQLVALLKRNTRTLSSVPALLAQAMRYARSVVAGRQSVAAARRNISHHYDLDDRLYRLFLDPDLQYTCAYFEERGQSLEMAQLAKKRHLAAKLLVEPGQSVLDIGSGWGGLAIYLGSVARAHVTGVTLSRPQYEVATRRTAERGLGEQVQFLLSDYRDVKRSFDRIVSVGMFEAIGRKSFDVFFQTASRLLARKGVFVLHSIGRTRPLRVQSPWMEKHIFPGSYIPALSEVLPAIERAGLLVGDLEILREHYAETLLAWRDRLKLRRDEVVALYGERFYRMWEFYLAVSEAAFRIDRLFIMQLQLTKHQDVLPRCRNYIAEREAALRAEELTLPAYATV